MRTVLPSLVLAFAFSGMAGGAARAQTPGWAPTPFPFMYGQTSIPSPTVGSASTFSYTFSATDRDTEYADDGTSRSFPGSVILFFGGVTSMAPGSWQITGGEDMGTGNFSWTLTGTAVTVTTGSVFVDEFQLKDTQMSRHPFYDQPLPIQQGVTVTP